MLSTPVYLRHATVDDIQTITEIFNALIDTTTITWTNRHDTVDERRQWFDRQMSLNHPVLVAEIDGDVVGVATYGAFRDNQRTPGYRFTVELSIHVRTTHHRQGIGRALLERLVAEAHERGMHAIIGAVDGDNHASIALHEALGFTEVGRFPEVGYKFDRWLDVVFMQKILA